MEFQGESDKSRVTVMSPQNRSIPSPEQEPDIEKTQNRIRRRRSRYGGELARWRER